MGSTTRACLLLMSLNRWTTIKIISFIRLNPFYFERIKLHTINDANVCFCSVLIQVGMSYTGIPFEPFLIIPLENLDVSYVRDNLCNDHVRSEHTCFYNFTLNLIFFKSILIAIKVSFFGVSSGLPQTVWTNKWFQVVQNSNKCMVHGRHTAQRSDA